MCIKHLGVMNPSFNACLYYLESKIDNGTPAIECDYSKLLVLCLAQFFAFPNWFITPGFVLTDNYKLDYLTRSNSTQPGQSCGKQSDHVVVEVKETMLGHGDV